MAFLAGKRISIAGAGVGGTAFALALEQACTSRGISPLPIIKLFERDASPTVRENLGYSFSLEDQKGTGGLEVIHQLQRGILGDLRKLQEPGCDAHFCYQTCDPIIELSPKPEEGTIDILRIMRTRLRQTLLSKVPPQCVQYGKTCVSAVPAAQADEPVRVYFADGSTEACDLLVVADGANSKLRLDMLPHEVNNYAGLCMLFGRTGPLEQLPPPIKKGLHLVLGKGSKSLFMGSVDKNTVVWGLNSKVPRSRVDEINDLLEDPASAKDFLEKEVPKIAEGFSGELMDTVMKLTPADSLVAIPAVGKFPHPIHDNGVVYIGDAWHPMSPFAGVGANMALQDAWQLAQQLVNGGHSNAQAAISQFATENARRSAEAINGSYRNIAVAHCEGWRKLLLATVLRTAGVLLPFWFKVSGWVSRLRSRSAQKLA